jgi:hypothetical protein
MDEVLGDVTRQKAWLLGRRVAPLAANDVWEIPMT